MKWDIDLPFEPAIPLFGVHSRDEKHVYKDLDKSLHSSLIHNNTKNDKSISRTMGNNLCYMNPIKYYSAITRDELLIYATTRTNLKTIMKSGRSQTQNSDYFRSSCLWNLLKINLICCDRYQKLVTPEWWELTWKECMGMSYILIGW